MTAQHEKTAPRDFHHPFTPYDIQVQFMTAVYDAIEDGCVGIFESPTGTGKSLSLLCGALTWLREHKSKELEAELKEDDVDHEEPEWVRKFAIEEKKKKIVQTRLEMENRLKAIRDKERREKEAISGSGPRKRQRIEIERDDKEADEDRYLLEDYDSDNESSSKAGVSGRYQDLSSETIALMKKLGYATSTEEKQDETELPDELKIYYCSRTHSQLSQFVNELRRIKMPSAIPDSELLEEEVKQLTLGSRKNLCINPGVKKLSSATAVNEKCLELQQSSTSAGRCKFLPTMEERYKFNDFRDNALASIRDIEELAELGTKLQVCPYYGARHALRPSEIVALPYPLLLQKSAREALGISLKGHIVIIDEAHNLMDAIESMYSTKVSLSQLERAKTLVVTYLGKFSKRLKGKNRVYIAQLLKVLNSLISSATETTGKGGEQTRIVVPNDLLSKGGADQVNLLKLIRYLNESKLPRKVEGYAVMKAEEGQDASSKKTSRTEVPVLNHLQTFLMALTNLTDEGKIFCGVIDEKTKEVGFSYMLLDPAFHFREIVEEARAVILAGGTMSPMADYITHLLPYLPTERVRTLSCGHVIPKDNLLAWPLSKGPSGRPLEFTFDKRSDPALIEELGKTIINLCIVIPHGVVAFFPSYAYLDSVIAQWKKIMFGDKTLWDRLCQRKKVFLESAGSSSVDETLRSYAEAVDQQNGALLLSVVGGKMSEGINFNDNLGRGVLMIGLPFPNANSAEWRAKMAHIESVTSLGLRQKGGNEAKAKAAGAAAAREFYENACMRAVNQSIGRAIRHLNDYAVIVLLDKRFQSERIKKKLPGWIGKSLESGVDGKFADLMGATTRFFRGKKDKH